MVANYSLIKLFALSRITTSFLVGSRFKLLDVHSTISNEHTKNEVSSLMGVLDLSYSLGKGMSLSWNAARLPPTYGSTSDDAGSKILGKGSEKTALPQVSDGYSVACHSTFTRGKTYV